MQKIHMVKGRCEAGVLPDFGGMVSQLRIDGVDVLFINESLLGIGNVLAGGIPVLFPFAGRCAGNEAFFRDRLYTMPPHGFVKERAFAQKRRWDSGCELYLESSADTLRLYPYAFALTLRYELVEDALKTTVLLKNCEKVSMPFALGFHPYFRMSDPCQTRFQFGLGE